MILKKLNTKNLLLILLLFLMIVFFETFQQSFYIQKFKLYENVQFSELLKTQFYRWIIWVVIGIPLIFLIQRDVKKEITLKLFSKYLGIIILLVLINVFIISSIQTVLSNDVFSVSKFFSEYFLFYLFQKSPMYILGYIAISIILFLSYSKNLLEIEVQELIELKRTNDNLYHQLKKANTDKTKVLNIKVGNKRKIIPVDSITWLEADDYCVIVHTIDNPSYSMRSSLKSLQEKLSDNFLRVHRKGIVNMNMTKELNLGGNPYVILKDNQEVLVSKSNLKSVKEFLKPNL